MQTETKLLFLTDRHRGDVICEVKRVGFSLNIFLSLASAGLEKLRVRVSGTFTDALPLKCGRGGDFRNVEHRKIEFFLSIFQTFPVHENSRSCETA